MRQFATGLNRTWLAIVGVLLLLAGLAGVAIGTGLATSVTSAAPTSSSRVIGSGAARTVASTGAVVVVLVIAVVAALLGLRWLLAQVPRTNGAAALRLQDDVATGLTTVEPKVLTDAVSRQVQTLPGVTAASAVMRGTADAPELTVTLTANDHTDVPALLRAVQTGPVADLESAIEAPLAHLGVQVDISPEKRTSDSVTF
ncbi:MAG: hypothetical protein JWP82_1009 [Humibacillus sp.]|nr:hypothetical protein [Humibacillus sp.]